MCEIIGGETFVNKMSLETIKTMAVKKYNCFPLSDGFEAIEQFLIRENIAKLTHAIYYRAFHELVDYFGVRKIYIYSKDSLKNCIVFMSDMRDSSTDRGSKQHYKYCVRVLGMMNDYYSGNDFRKRYDKKDHFGENPINVLVILREAYSAIEKYLIDRGLTATSIHNYYLSFKEIESYFIEHNIKEYSLQVMDSYRVTQLELLRSGQIHTTKYDYVTKTAKLIDAYYSGTPLDEALRAYIKANNEHNPDGELINGYVEHLKAKGLSDGTIIKLEYHVRKILYFYREKQIKISTLNPELVLECIKSQTMYSPNSMNTFLSSFRSFLDYLNSIGYNTISSKLVYNYKPAPPHKKYLPAFEEEDITNLINQPDRNTLIGKRDYAIFLLAVYTGMRACDISNLTIADLNRADRSITFQQSKTAKTNYLPIDDKIIDAIDDYLNSRGDTELPYLFQTIYKPYRKLNVRRILDSHSYFDRIGLDNRQKNRFGFHSFRRTLGKWMLESSSTPDQISQVLGHSGIKTIKHYIPTSAKLLKQCTLCLDFIPFEAEDYYL